MSDNDTRTWRRKAFEALLASPALSKRQARVAFAVVKRNKPDDDYSFPGYRRIALDCGYDERSVRNILDEICADVGTPENRPPEREAVAVFVREPGSRGRGRSARYYFRDEWADRVLADFERGQNAEPPPHDKSAAKTRAFEGGDKSAQNGSEKARKTDSEKRVFRTVKARGIAAQNPCRILIRRILIESFCLSKSDDFDQKNKRYAELIESMVFDPDLALHPFFESYAFADDVPAIKSLPGFREKLVAWLRAKGASRSVALSLATEVLNGLHDARQLRRAPSSPGDMQ